MSTKRLSVGKLQIYFDDHGAALFSDGMKRDRTAVETALSQDRDFIDRWLEVSEEKRPRHISEEEREFRAMLKRLGRGLKGSRYFEADFIKTIVQEVAQRLGGSSKLSAIQISESIEEAVSTL